jgi:hypothetical protein
MTAIQDARQHVTPIECASWCEDGDGHPREVHRHDQNCWSPASYGTMTQGEFVQDSGCAYSSRIGVMLHRRWNEAGTVYVHLELIDDGRGEIDRGLRFTPDEARALAGQLIAQASILDGGAQ